MLLLFMFWVKNFFVVQGWSEYCRMFSNIPGLYTPDVRRTSPLSQAIAVPSSLGALEAVDAGTLLVGAQCSEQERRGCSSFLIPCHLGDKAHCGTPIFFIKFQGSFREASSFTFPPWSGIKFAPIGAPGQLPVIVVTFFFKTPFPLKILYWTMLFLLFPTSPSEETRPWCS